MNFRRLIWVIFVTSLDPLWPFLQSTFSFLTCGTCRRCRRWS
uniref:Uncharacterized protein n=1 Tax=Lepeophtheirus salmonis TaxID=72036 RepID=A0A0K2TPM0_LEPSM